MSPVLLPLVLMASLAFANVVQAAAPDPDFSDVDQKLGALQSRLQQESSTGGISAQSMQSLQTQQNLVATRLAKVKSQGHPTPAEHTALLNSIDRQEQRLQKMAKHTAAAPTQGRVATTGSAAAPQPAAAATVPASAVGSVAGSTTTIGPNGEAIMSAGPVINGNPVGPAIVQPAFPNNPITPAAPAQTGVYGPSLGKAPAKADVTAPTGTYGPTFDKSGQKIDAPMAPGSNGPSLDK